MNRPKTQKSRIIFGKCCCFIMSREHQDILDELYLTQNDFRKSLVLKRSTKDSLHESAIFTKVKLIPNTELLIVSYFDKVLYRKMYTVVKNDTFESNRI